MKKIVIFGNLDLPEGSAGATRCVAFGDLVKSCGYKPILLGVNYSMSDKIKGKYQNLDYELLSFKELKYTGSKKILRKKILKDYIFKWLTENCTKDNTHCIILYNVKSELKWFIKFSENYNIPLIKDVVEWYDKNNFVGISGFFNYVEDRVGLFYWNKKCKNIIAISTLFANFYKEKKCNVIRIPTILDTNLFNNIEYREQQKELNKKKIKIMYAGSPMKKDYVFNIVKSLLLLNEDDLNKIELNLYGLTWNYFLNNGINKNDMIKLKDNVFCHGRVSHEEVKKNLKSTDFTILLRPNVRYANAGFPTKVGESMASGIPVISNITSDLYLYLHDGVEGIVCDDSTSQACSEAIKKAINLKSNKLDEMKVNSKKQALQSFDYRAYTEDFGKFLIEVGSE